jgi:hypothetical protein
MGTKKLVYIVSQIKYLWHAYQILTRKLIVDPKSMKFIVKPLQGLIKLVLEMHTPSVQF